MKEIYLTLVVGLFLVPTILISQTVSISGQIIRHNGVPVPDVEVFCDGNIATDANGNFEFTNVPFGYSCQMTATGFFSKFDDVTVLDAVKIRNAILELEGINSYQQIAADINNTFSVTTLDIVKLYPLILHIDDGNPNMWICVDASHDFLMPAPNATPSIINISEIMSDIVDADFIAIKRGDVAINSDHMPAPSSAPVPTFTLSHEMFQVGNDVQFEVAVEDFSDIVGFQQTFKWDPSILEYESISGGQDVSVEVSTSKLSEGLLPSLSVMNPMTLQDGTVVLTLNFKVLSAVPNPIEVLSFSDDLAPRQVVWQNLTDNKLFILDTEYLNGEGTTGVVNSPAGLESFQVFPNPTGNDLHVKALLKNAEDFEISIVNVLGQKVYSENFDQKELLLNIGFGEFSAGTYFLSLKTADGIQTESFVKK